MIRNWFWFEFSILRPFLNLINNRFAFGLAVYWFGMKVVETVRSISGISKVRDSAMRRTGDVPMVGFSPTGNAGSYVRLDNRWQQGEATSRFRYTHQIATSQSTIGMKCRCPSCSVSESLSAEVQLIVDLT
jgi:hypothetical protein